MVWGRVKRDWARGTEAWFILPHSRTLCHAVVLSLRWRLVHIAILWAAVVTTWGNSFCLDLSLSDSLKKLLDTCAVTVLLPRHRTERVQNNPAVCFSCLLIMCKHIATRVYLKKKLLYIFVDLHRLFTSLCIDLHKPFWGGWLQGKDEIIY